MPPAPTSDAPPPAGLRTSAVAAGWITLLRWLLGLAFIAPGLEKLAGRNIHHVAPGADVMPLFDALHAVGPYWTFLGLGQVAGGALLLVPRLAATGTLVCLPIMANIYVLLLALPFTTADRVAGTLLLGAHLVLLAWEWPRLAPLLAAPARTGSVRGAVVHSLRLRWFRVSAAVLASAWLVVHLVDRLNDP